MMVEFRKPIFVCLAGLALGAAALAFPFGPDPGLTGGFGQGTCVQCHSSYRLNEGRTRGGMFFISGVPRVYSPGTSYPLSVVIAHPGQKRWGFELSARFQNSGAQAGRFIIPDESVQIKTAHAIQYIEHTETGTRWGHSDGPVEFQFTWVAPLRSSGPIYFNAAGNAANGNDQPEGDFIYTAGAFTSGNARPVQVRKEPASTGGRARRASNDPVLVDLPVPLDRRKGQWDLIIQHRFLGAVDSGAGNAFGIDFGANINLGLNFAFSERLSAGISRARFGKIVAFNGTLELPTPRPSFWKSALVGGVEGQSNFQRQYSPFLQSTNSFDLGPVRAFLVPTLVFNSRDEEEVAGRLSEAVNPGSNSTLSLGLGADVALGRRVSIVGEYVPRLAGFGGLDPPGVEEFPSISGGIKLRTWGHVFTILASSSRDFTPAGYAIRGTSRNIFLGFNIYRRMH